MAITNIHEDIIKTHILTKLDGQTLAAAGCTSSYLQSLCSDQTLWSNICRSNWPSTADELINKHISNFSSGHRSFYSDAASPPAHYLTTATSSPPTGQIISSVDLRYRDELIFSKVESTNTTASDWFQTTPFRVDLIEKKEIVFSPVKFSGDGQVLLTELGNNMSLSWIIIDPVQNRAVNVSSVKPVSVQRNWLTNDVELTFAVVVEPDYVNCNVQVTCGMNEGKFGNLTVSGVSLTVLDVYGKCLSGKDSMVILQGLIAAERRGGEGWKERYDEYIERRKERKEIMERRERRLDLVRVACVMGFLGALWSLAFY